MKTILFYPINNDMVKKEDTIYLKIQKCGGNTGNVVWAEAVKNHIYYERKWMPEDMNFMEEVHYILPMANQLNVYDEYIKIFRDRLLKNTKAKISMLGLGSQLTKEFNTPQKLVQALPVEQKKALKDLSLHTELIGVRGHITAECLDLLGIHNHIIIGCPSFYSYGAEFPFIKKPSLNNVCFNWSGTAVDAGLQSKIMLGGGHKWNCLVMQCMSDLPRTVFENAPILERHSKRLFPEGNISPENLTKYLKHVGKIFFSTQEWGKYLAEEKFTMSVGCRFHGNMRALLSGIPALWVIHDSRTAELAEALHLPRIFVNDANNIKDLNELQAYCEYGEDFYSNYEKMYQNYVKCLKVNGLMQK